MTETADTPAQVQEAMPQSVEYWAARKPDEIAIYEGDRTLTWREWNDQADRLANGLANRGVGPGDIVAVRTQIRLEWGVINAALAKLGCSLLGLNWRLTPSEVRFVFSNSKAVVLFCDDADPTALVQSLKEFDLKVFVSLDAAAAGVTAWEDARNGQSVRRFARQEAPLIIYTSGTTGVPKGVSSVRANSATLDERKAYAASMEARVPRQPDDVLLVCMPFSHGAGPGLVRSGIRAGNKMVFMRRFEPELALELIERHGVTFWLTVPTMLKRLAALPPRAISARDLSSLRALQTGAAPVPQALKAWVAETISPDILNEGYGSTETSMICQIGPEMLRLKPGSSGLPFQHVHIRVRDEEGALLPSGVAGELWVKTPMTIGAYLNAPPLDNATLDTDGFFRTGDVGYLDDDGYLFITDRVKDMIISGGVNIYPAEVEAALQLHPAVEDAVVIGIPDDEFGEQVKAFVELKASHELDERELLAFAGDHLASYKRPKTVEFVAELPRNVMGKVLKKDLRAPYWAGRERKV